jgi:hypothetical protein
MSGLTLGHILYGAAAVELVAVLGFGLSALRADPDGPADRRRAGVLFIAAGIITAAALAGIATFSNVGRMPLG